jgi:hypothetical protein
MTDDRVRLETLTQRWRARHEARRSSVPQRPRADDERQTRAASAFPYRAESPQAYADAHGQAMIGFTYDAYRYDDPQLDAWLLELGDILRTRRGT